MNSATHAASIDTTRIALERELQRLWQELLEVPQIGVDDDFFVLGGHSLLAIELRAELRKLLQAPRLTIDTLRTSTISTMAAAILDELNVGEAVGEAA